MSNRDDKTLQKYLRGDSEISRRYRSLDKPEPAAALDASILAAAREEAARPVRPAWMIPVSLAATVVLGVGLSVQLLTPHGSPPLDIVHDAAAPATVEAAQSEAAGPASAATGHETALETRRHVLRQSLSNTREEVLANTPPQFVPPPMLRSSVATEPDEPRRNLKAEAVPRLKSAPPVATIDATDAGKDNVAAMASRVNTRPVSAERRKARQEGFALQAPATEAVVEADIATGARRSGYRSDDSLDLSASERFVQSYRADPKRYLEMIEATWERGDEDLARALLVEFRKQYPDYELPATFPLEDPQKEPAGAPASPPDE